MLWNFSEWMNRLGLQRQAQPELIYGVQPVVVMGDQSALVSPVLPPMAWQGARRSAVAAPFSAFDFTSRAAGGTFIRQLIMSCDVSMQVRWQINTAPVAMLDLVVPLVFDMAPDPTVSRLRLGTIVAQPATQTVPTVDVLSGGNTFLLDGFYLQPGTTLQGWTAAVNRDLVVNVQFEDLPATVPRS